MAELKGNIESNAPESASIAVTEAPATAPVFTLEGYVDAYGYHTLAGGWCLIGWASRHDDLVKTLSRIEARFAQETLEGEVTALTFGRDDITDRDAIGFLIFLPAPISTPGLLQSLVLEAAGATHALLPVRNAHLVLESALVERLDFILSTVEAGPRRTAMALRLNGWRELQGHGYIEYYGYHHNAGGWFFSGWVSRGWPDGEMPKRLLISVDGQNMRSAVVATLYTRNELPEGACGALFFVPGRLGITGMVTSLALRCGNVPLLLLPVGNLPQLREAELTARVKATIGLARPGLYRDRLANILARRPFVGEDTLEALSPAIFMYVDHAFLCGPSGLLLMGWMLAKPDEIREVRVRCGEQMAVLQPHSFVRNERHDVLEGFAKYGYEDTQCGFIAYLPDVVRPDAKIYIEAETQRFELGYRNIPAPVRGGMNAMKQLLGSVDVRFADLAPAFDRVLGPAVAAMNAERLAVRVGRQVVEYGTMPRAPKYSVLVPLYGRLDFVEYQMGLFSARAGHDDVEYVFVLDDPPKRREAQHLFASVHARFGIPFRAVLLERNLGFAPANNVGMEYCHGDYLVYLNSDVFPGSLDWLERLCARLEADAQLGVVGPLLLFEDGAVQHRGMYFEKLEEYGQWFFCQHLDKGLRYTGAGGLETFICITGACMMLRRDLAQRLGGFDEIYAIGDFEDSDLCLKILQLGLKCGVDPDVVLYHLERKSQLSGALTWRANLTAYNAWQHQRRWGKTIAQKQAQDFQVQA